jgi:hypothetical protein
MVRQTVVVLLAAAMMGCTGGGKSKAPTTSSSAAAAPTSRATDTVDAPAVAMSDNQLAAYAGAAEFPTARPRNDARIAAIVTKDRQTIKIYNFDANAMRAVNVWVNGAYVQPLQALPAHSKAYIRGDKLFNKNGDRFSTRGEEVTRVQLETQDGLYDVLGPASE